MKLAFYGWVIALCLQASFITSGFTLTLQEKILTSSPKSYVVYLNQNTYSLLIYHSKKDSSFYLEEIDIPKHLVKPSTNWKKWIEDGAKDASAHLIYEIDIETSEIETCYSFTKQSFCFLSQEGLFLKQLMKLPLNRLSNSDRKKIGGAELDGQDMRKVWNPPKVVYGKKITSKAFDAYETKWPKDSSELSGLTLQCYLDKDDPSFSFPYWVEIGNTEQHINLKAIDSGYLDHLTSYMPKAPPEIQKLTWSKTALQIELKTSNQKEPVLFMIVDKNSFHKTSVLLSESTQIATSKKSCLVTFPMSYLEKILIKNHKYHLFVLSEDSSLSMEYPYDLSLPQTKSL